MSIYPSVHLSVRCSMSTSARMQCSKILPKNKKKSMIMFKKKIHDYVLIKNPWLCFDIHCQLKNKTLQIDTRESSDSLGRQKTNRGNSGLLMLTLTNLKEVSTLVFAKYWTNGTIKRKGSWTKFVQLLNPRFYVKFL